MKIGHISFSEEEVKNKRTSMFIDKNEDLITREEYVIDSAEYGLIFIKVDYKNKKEIGYYVENSDGSVERYGSFDPILRDSYERQ